MGTSAPQKGEVIPQGGTRLTKGGMRNLGELGRNKQKESGTEGSQQRESGLAIMVRGTGNMKNGERHEAVGPELQIGSTQKEVGEVWLEVSECRTENVVATGCLVAVHVGVHSEVQVGPWNDAASPFSNIVLSADMVTQPLPTLMASLRREAAKTFSETKNGVRNLRRV